MRLALQTTPSIARFGLDRLQADHVLQARCKDAALHTGHEQTASPSFALESFDVCLIIYVLDLSVLIFHDVDLGEIDNILPDVEAEHLDALAMYRLCLLKEQSGCDLLLFRIYDEPIDLVAKTFKSRIDRIEEGVVIV